MTFLNSALRYGGKALRQSFWASMAVMLCLGTSFDGRNFFVNAKAETDAGADADEGPIIGIDLGTTYSCVAAYKAGRIEIVTNDQGNRITPSWVAFIGDAKNPETVVGDAAKERAKFDSTGVVFDAKRMLGRSFKDPEIQKDLKHWPFTVINTDGMPKIKLPTRDAPIDPRMVSATVLRYLKEQAEKFLGREVKRAVITVPAYFNDNQRTATKDAGTIAGLKVERLLNEPTAAAMAYGLGKGKEEQKILVYDLGGGTFDVSVLTIEDGVYEVNAVNGDTHLGGQDFDQRLITHLMEQIKVKYSDFDIAKNKRVVPKIRSEAEKAKRLLSSQTSVNINIENVHEGNDFSYTLSRAKFEKLNEDLFKSTLVPVKKALEDAKMTKKDISQIVLVGGSTRIPKIQELLRNFFDGRELNQSINPDEAVAYGAAVQAGVLSGEELAKDVLVIDVTPLSAGIETAGGVMTVLVPRNTAIPTKKASTFSTYTDNQTSVQIKIYEGERAMAKDNHLLGEFLLSNIPPAPRGVPQIEVTFEIDANSIMTVSAKDKGTGRSHSISITSKSRLSKEEIEKAIEEAEKNRKADEEAKERVEAHSTLENYIYSIKGQVEDEKGVGSKIAADDKEKIKKLISETESWMMQHRESATKEDYEEHQAQLKEVIDPVIAKLYQEQGGQGGSSEGQAAGSDHEEL